MFGNGFAVIRDEQYQLAKQINRKGVIEITGVTFIKTKNVHQKIFYILHKNN